MHEEQFWILVSKKITGEASAGELLLLERFIEADPSRRSILESLEEFWASSSPSLAKQSGLNAESAYLAHISRLNSIELSVPSVSNNTEAEILPFPETKKPFYKQRFSYWLALFLFIIGLGIFYGLRSKTSAPENLVENTSGHILNEVSISPGSRSKIQLPDGSQVWINASSKLSYPKTFSPKSREVYLDGEAYFDVVHDPAHPFIVHTSAIDIKALGTAFNVKSYDADPTIEATLIHGSIEVSRPGQPNSPTILLKPHEKLVLNKSLEPRVLGNSPQSSRITYANAISVSPVKMNRPDSEIVETAWVYNKLAFEDEKFADIARKMEKWFKVNITIESTRLSNYTLTGSFVNENIDEALKMLQYFVPFKYTIEENEVKIFE